MSTFVETEEVKQITFNGANPTLGNQNVQFRIQRQSRWLSDIIIHVNYTLGGTLSATANRDYVEGIFNEVRLRVSDKAGPNRLAIKAPSTSLIAWHNATHPANDRFSQRIIRNSAAVAAGTYDLFVPVHLRHPAIGEPIGVRTCLPLFSSSTGTGVADDVILELDLAATATALNLGASATLTINRITAKLIYVNAPDTIIYVPQELVSQLPTVTAATAGGYDIARNGYLSSMLLEEFTDTAYAVRGSFLPSVTGADYFTLKYGRTGFKDFYPRELMVRGDWFSVPKPDNGTTEVVGQTPFVSFLDLLNPRPNDDAFSGNSMLSLYGDQQGDLARLEWNAAASANARIRALMHKFFTTNLAELQGA
jgi:hypothetical protein